MKEGRKMKEIWMGGRKEGRDKVKVKNGEGRKEGEGRKGGRKGGRMEGEGRKEGEEKKEGITCTVR